MSYNGQFRFCISADDRICRTQKDMDAIVDYIQDELEELENTVIAKDFAEIV